MSAPNYVCRDFVEEITAYLEGALPDERVAIIDAHLEGCPHCREYLREMRLTIKAAGSLADHDVADLPDDVRTQLLDAFRNAPD